MLKYEFDDFLLRDGFRVAKGGDFIGRSNEGTTATSTGVAENAEASEAQDHHILSLRVSWGDKMLRISIQEYPINMRKRPPTLIEDPPQKLSMKEHERLLISACRAAAVILEARKGEGRELDAQEPLPPSTIEALRRFPKAKTWH